MYPLNLNIEDWSLVNSTDSSEFAPISTDVVALADYISAANDFDLCDLNNHEYTH
jgi:hypothetical protein